MSKVIADRLPGEEVTAAYGVGRQDTDRAELLRTGIVHDLGDLHELNGGRDTV